MTVALLRRETIIYNAIRSYWLTCVFSREQHNESLSPARVRGTKAKLLGAQPMVHTERHLPFTYAIIFDIVHSETYVAFPYACVRVV